MAWMDPDGLYRQYGTEKAVPTLAGDFSMPGAIRDLEYTIDLAGLTASPKIYGNTSFVPAGVYIEAVELDVEIAAVGGTTFSVGLIGNDRTTVSSNTGFVNAIATASLTQGAKIVLVGGSTGAGGYVGSASNVPNTGYVTATAAGTYTAGRIKVRIRYRGIGTITQ